MANRRFYTDCIVLLLALLAVYLPVTWLLPIRTTGDEKVYIAQALEMAQHGTWYKQMLWNEPNYYKGPLFYLLLRLGFVLFGATAPAALTYMNVAGYAAAAVALLALVNHHLKPNRAAGWLAAAVVVFSAGGYAHALASQMEALLVAVYALFMAALGSAKPGPSGQRARLAAWTLAGVAGWLKSPLHSLLLALSALLYWALTGQLKSQLRSSAFWLGGLWGIAVGIAAYLPSLLFDRSAFIASYIERETLSKVPNGVGIDEAVVPFVTAHLLPWLPLLVVGLLLWLGTLASRRQSRRVWSFQPLTILAWSVALPTLAFFIYHPYRSGIYILPILPAAAVLIAQRWASEREQHPRWFAAAFGLMAALILIVTAALSALLWRFAPWPPWLPPQVITYTVVSLGLASAAMALAATQRSAGRQALAAVAASALLFAGSGPLSTALFAHESFDVSQLGPQDAAKPYVHVNLNHHLWSETGLLNMMLRRAVIGVQTPEELAKTLVPGQVFLVPDDSQLAALQKAVAALPELKLEAKPWRRWRLHGETDQGESLWQAAWQARSLALLERTQYVATLTTDRLAAQSGKD